MVSKSMEKTKVYCDRCGNEIEYPIEKHFNLVKRKLRLINRIDHEDVDLCQECSTSLENWFKNIGE